MLTGIFQKKFKTTVLFINGEIRSRFNSKMGKNLFGVLKKVLISWGLSDIQIRDLTDYLFYFV